MFLNFLSSSRGCCCALFLNFLRFRTLLCCFLHICVSSPVQTSYIGGLLIVLRLALSPSLLFSLSWTWYCCLFLHRRWYTFVLIVMWEVNKSPMTCILLYWYIIFVHSVFHPPSPYVHFVSFQNTLPFYINLILNNTLLIDLICHHDIIKIQIIFF